MTFVLEIIRLGIKNIGLHKLRSSLTSLGIILGVAAVIIVVSIGEGNKQSTLRQITDLGATNIIIRSQKPPSTQSASTSNTFVVEYGLTRLDLKRLQEFVGPAADAGEGAGLESGSTRGLRGKHLVPLKAVGSEIRRRNERTVSQVFGTIPDLSRTANLSVRPGGRYLVDADVEGSAPVAVIGSEIADTFFRLEDPVGKDLRIDSQVFNPSGNDERATQSTSQEKWVSFPITKAVEHLKSGFFESRFLSSSSISSSTIIFLHSFVYHSLAVDAHRNQCLTDMCIQ